MFEQPLDLQWYYTSISLSPVPTSSRPQIPFRIPIYSHIQFFPPSHPHPLFSSGWYLCAQKSSYVLHPLSEVFPKLHLKQFQCPSDDALSRPFKEDRQAHPLSTPLSSRWSMVWCLWLCGDRQSLKLLTYYFYLHLTLTCNSHLHFTLPYRSYHPPHSHLQFLSHCSHLQVLLPSHSPAQFICPRFHTIPTLIHNLYFIILTYNSRLHLTHIQFIFHHSHMQFLPPVCFLLSALHSQQTSVAPCIPPAPPSAPLTWAAVSSVHSSVPCDSPVSLCNLC